MLAHMPRLGKFCPLSCRLINRIFIKPEGETMTALVPFFSDLSSALKSLQFSDFIPTILWLLWITILFIKLKGIDLRDDLTKLCYMVVVLAFGCLLLIALPAIWGSYRSPLENVLLAGLFIAAAHFRWILASGTGGQQTVTSKRKGDVKAK